MGYTFLMEYLASLDRELFLAIHNFIRSPLIDGFALFISGVGSFGIVWFLGGLWLYFKEEMEDNQLFFLPILLALGSSIVLVEFVLKPLISRVRPSVAFGLLVGDTAAFGSSFPSAHATLAFAGATVLSAREPRLKTILYVIAVLISVSRIYLGVHYPSDIIAGAVLGFGIGRIALSLSSAVESKRKRMNIFPKARRIRRRK